MIDSKPLVSAHALSDMANVSYPGVEGLAFGKTFEQRAASFFVGLSDSINQCYGAFSVLDMIVAF